MTDGREHVSIVKCEDRSSIICDCSHPTVGGPD
jgi:hypothetical protein